MRKRLSHHQYEWPVGKSTMKNLPAPASDNSKHASHADICSPEYSSSSTSAGHQVEPPEIARQIDNYRMQIVQDNAEHGMVPFFLATLSFAALLVYFSQGSRMLSWLPAVLSLGGLRLLLISKYSAGSSRCDKR